MLLNFAHVAHRYKNNRDNRLRKTIPPRKKATLLTVLMFISIVTSLPLLRPTDVGAVTTVASKADSDFTWRTQSFLYYRTLAKCMKDSSLSYTLIPPNHISESDAKVGKWFADFYADPSVVTPAIGVYMRDATPGDALGVNSDGKVDCYNGSLITSAASLWGLSPITILCNSGFRRVDLGADQSIKTCVDGSGNFERRDGGQANNVAKFTAYIKDQVYGGKEPDLTNPEWYIYYRHSLAKSCIPGIDTKAPGTDTYSNDNTKGYNGVKWVDTLSEKKSIKTGSYLGNWQKSENVVLRTAAPSAYNSYEKNCAEVVSLMNNYAQDYLSWASTLSPAVIESAEGTGNQALNPSGDSTTSCAVEGIGWIVCPVAAFLGTITDGLFKVLTTLLSFTPLTTTQSPTYNAWQAMRNIANAAFVIAFLLIIFSQLTSMGINNYGVKKLLPRIVIAAILVNLSYFICSIAVDLSNILGYSMQSLFTNAIPSSGDPTGNNLSVWGDLVGWVIAGGVGGLGALTIVSAGGFMPALALLLPILVTALFAMLTVVLVLAARQAILIIMIVISPLAFVAYLLPNTESLFTKWRKLFTTLLLLFPIISVVFGGSQLAASIIRADTTNPLVYILSLGVQVIPFFLVPLILKAGGGVLSRFGGMVNNPNKGPFDKLRKNAQGVADSAGARSRTNQLDRFAATGKGGRFARWQIRRNATHASSESNLKSATTDYIADAAAATGPATDGSAEGIIGDNKFARQMAGGNKTIQNAVVASALAQKEKAYREEIGNMEALIKVKFANDPKAALKDALGRADGGVQAVAAQNLMYAQGSGGINAFKDTISENQKDMDSHVSQALSQNTLEVHGQTTKAKAKDVLQWAKNGGTDIDAATNDSQTWAGMADNEVITQTGASLASAAKSGGLTPEQAQSILSNDRINSNLDATQKQSLAEATYQVNIRAGSSSPAVNVNITQPPVNGNPSTPFTINTNGAQAPANKYTSLNTPPANIDIQHGGSVDPANIPTNLFGPK